MAQNWLAMTSAPAGRPAAPAERVFVVFNALGLEIEFELTQAVEDTMFLMRSLQPDLAADVEHQLRESTIQRAAEHVARVQRRRGDVSTPWVIRRR